MNTLQSALGHYDSMGNPTDADCIVGHSFGTMVGEDSVNRLLATTMLHYADGRSMIADRMLADAFPENSEPLAKVVEGPISDIKGGGLGTWGALLIIKDYLNQEGLERPLMVAHKHHIGRVVRQAAKLGIASIVPNDLPGQFDRKSKQLWTKSVLPWVLMDVVNSAKLRRQGRL
jgi:hypothetical protein